MRWISHVAIACSVCAVFNPTAVAAAALGATAPDWMEFLIAATRRDKYVKHRATTHYLTAWIGLMLFASFIVDWQNWLFWFAVGGATHWVCDALTITGAPLSWWSDRNMTLFGGKISTGTMSEYLTTGVICLICAFFIWSRHTGGGFMPYFYKWGEMYEKGIIDGHEWRSNRFNVI